MTAWDGDTLVGLSRSMTDFYFACYLSDLAVHEDYQKQGIGKKLQSLTQKELGPRCKIILLAAPGASHYYEPLGFVYDDRCWVLPRDVEI